jgi:peptidoglycan/xylan/chitin deacetylase (PgdA/CDA1 family)
MGMPSRHHRDLHWRRRRLAPLLLAVVVGLVATAVAAVVVSAGNGDGGRTTPGPGASPSRLLAPRPQAGAKGRRHRRAAGPRFVAHPKPVVVLVYHHFSHTKRGSRLLYVGRREFNAQMRYLARHGYRAVTLQQVYDAWTGGPALPRHAIVLSFDDGYVGQSSFAAVVLRRHHWPGVLNLIVDNLYPRTRFSAVMVRRLIASGWELDSHTVTHRPLTLLTAAAVRRELVASRTYLQRHFAVPVNFFCYPGGDYDRTVARAVRRAGYLGATGTDFAAATPARLFVMGRVYCYWGESLAVFAGRLHSATAIARRQLKRSSPSVRR